MSEVHLLKDESLGGVLREYVEVDRKAEIGDKVIYVYKGERDGKIVTVTKVEDDVGIRFDNQLENYDGYGTCGFADEAYRVLEPTDIVQIDGQRFRLVERKAEVGEKIIVINTNIQWNAKNGQISVVDVVYGDGSGVRGISDDECFPLGHEEYNVLVPFEPVEPTETTPEVTDLLTNLARRVTSLESKNRSLSEQLADTQHNVERQAEELESIKHPSPVDSAVMTQDNVNSPSHYTQGRFETIDVIEDIVSGYDDPFVAHCVGTATKYLYRAPFKHETPTEDLRKAAKYLAFAIDYLTKGDQ